MAGGYSDEYAFEIAAPQITPARRPPPAAATLPPPAALPAAGPPPPCAPLASLGLLYIKSHRLARLALRAPVNRDRAALVPALLAAAGLLDGPGVAVEEARPASVEELRQYHSADYLAALVSPHPAEGRRPAALHRFGLADDCAPWPGVYDHAALCAGGSLQAAAALCARRCRAAVHLDGGRHHARRGAAAGYCYLNDCVLAVLRLLESFPRVLYVDVDAHHGDAVEEAFLATDRVCTLSLHHRSPGFFPGTGALGAGGEGAGAGFALNLPLGEGLRDELFARAFRAAAGGAVAAFRPDCVVLQCGVDGLAGDPVAHCWSLTPAAYHAAAAAATEWKLPLLVLGGGGYDSPAAACAWGGVVAALQGREAPEDVPEHAYFDRYGPSFSMRTPGRPPLGPDANTAASVDAACAAVLRGLAAAQGRHAEQRQAGGSSGSGIANKKMKR